MAGEKGFKMTFEIVIFGIHNKLPINYLVLTLVWKIAIQLKTLNNWKCEIFENVDWVLYNVGSIPIKYSITK